MWNLSKVLGTKVDVQAPLMPLRYDLNSIVKQKAEHEVKTRLLERERKVKETHRLEMRDHQIVSCFFFCRTCGNQDVEIYHAEKLSNGVVDVESKRSL